MNKRQRKKLRKGQYIKLKKIDPKYNDGYKYTISKKVIDKWVDSLFSEDK